VVSDTVFLLAVAMILSQSGAARGPAPKGVEAVQQAFVLGELARATEAARACARKEPRVCKPLVRSLGQYAPLAKLGDKLTAVQARQLLDLDRQISPRVTGAISKRAIEKFVTAPLDLARHHAQQGNAASARVIAQQVLEVDPLNPEARALAANP
jgi:hypothetical protein